MSLEQDFSQNLVPTCLVPTFEEYVPFIERKNLPENISPYIDQLIKSLNEDQAKTINSILEWSKELFPKYSAQTIVGYSGSGKTFCIRTLAALLPNIVLCAPTNKAVKELLKLNTGAMCCTIYSLLGLRMEEHEDTIKLTKVEASKVKKYKYVILDEVGMVNSELFEYIDRSLEAGTRFIFVGDPKQLPPVGESISPIWNKEYPVHKLLKVVRHDNQILDIATKIRKCKIHEIENVLESNNANDEGVWYIDYAAFENKIKEYASQNKFENDTKILSWRNKIVDRYNNIVRKQIYGDLINTSKYLVTDKIVFASPYEVDKGTSITTDEEGFIDNITVAPHTDYRELQCYYLKVNIDSGIYLIKTIHEDSEKRLAEILSDLATIARQTKKGHLWKNFWLLKKSLANIKFAYALTVHRSQGSTYENVFVDCDDILKNPNKKEAKKCLYVAVSRPSKRLFIC